MSLVLEPEIREQSATPMVVCPWVENPYALVSWWDMERFAAAAFHDIGTNIGTLTCKLERLPQDLDAVELATDYRPLLALIRECCAKIGLRMSPLCIDEFFAKLQHGMTADEMRSSLTALNGSIRWEMQAVFFFYMPWEQVNFYDQRELFGARVNARFPTIQYDMVEAGNCCAMGRGTACVFHLMRVMEVGVQNFAKALGAPFLPGMSWQNILDGINKKLSALAPDAPRRVEMAQAAANLYAVKLAWRNEVMHPNDKYKLEEAKDLIGQVKLFMGQLASII